MAAPPGEVLAALEDFEHMPEWQRSLERCQVLEHGSDGRAAEVEYTVDVRFGRVSYRLRHTYPEHADGSLEVTSDYVSGDFSSLAGGWRLWPEGAGTRVRLELWIDPGVWVPGRVARAIHDRVLRGSLEDLENRVAKPQTAVSQAS